MSPVCNPRSLTRNVSEYRRNPGFHQSLVDVHQGGGGGSTVIVGAGIGGAYTAWRLAVDDGGRKVAGRSICVFEAAARPGGRILTFRDAPSPFDGSAVDLGAYRFHRGEHAMVRSVAEGRLGLVTHCYSDPLGDTLRGMAAGVNGTADHVTRRVAVCPPQTRPVTVARGVAFAGAVAW